MRIISVLGGVAAVIVALMIVSYVTQPGGAGNVETSGTSDPDGPPQPNELGRYPSNPFIPEEPFPRAETETTEHDFGRMLFGDKATHGFVIKNTGEGPLKLAQGYATCKCTIGDIGAEEIPPGGEGTVTMEWEPPAESLSFSQSAIIYTNDPETPEFTFNVHGMVVPRIMTEPQGTWALGTLIEGEARPVTGHVVAMLADEFEILSIATSADYVTATWEPIDEEHLAESHGKCGYAIKVVVEPEMPVGKFEESLTVTTDLPENETITFTMSGIRVGPFSMVGKHYSSAFRTFNLGRIPSDEGLTSQATLFVLGAENPADVQFRSVEPPIVNVDVTEGTTENGDKKFVIEITVPPGVEPGRYIGEDALKLTFETTHPEAPTLEYDLTFQVD